MEAWRKGYTRGKQKGPTSTLDNLGLLMEAAQHIYIVHETALRLRPLQGVVSRLTIRLWGHTGGTNPVLRGSPRDGE